MSPNRKLAYAMIAVICVGYTVLRFWNLTASCLWFDEIFSVHAAEHSWNSILSFVALDLIHPPLFYVLLKIWIIIGGESLFWLRILPVLFAILTVFPLIALYRTLRLDPWVQCIALFLIAVNGSMIKYSQEVRMYSLLLFLSLFSYWLFARYFRKGKSFAALLIINIILVYTHYFGWFVVSSEIAAIVILQREKWLKMTAMFAITLLVFIPWIYAISNAAQQGEGLSQNIGWMTRPGATTVVQFVLNLIEPFYYAASSVEPFSIYRVSVPLLILLPIVSAVFVLDWTHQCDDDKAAIRLLLIFVTVPLLLAFIASWLLPYSVWGTRHLIIVFAPAAILFAVGITRMRSSGFRTAAVTLLLLFTGYALVLEERRPAPQYIWCGWEQLAPIAESIDVKRIYVFEDLVAYHFWFATRKYKPEPQILKISGINGVTEDKAYFLPRGFEEVRSVKFDDITDNRLWLAYRGQPVDPNKLPLSSFLLRGYTIIDSKVVAADNENAIMVELERVPDR
jgi:uncharacterized membrane protein